MDRFAAIEAFVRVAEAQSFSVAARRLRSSKSAVSRNVSNLEEDLGVQLIQRTTRSLTLTEAGRGYFERAARILADLDEAHQAVTQLQAAPRGRIRLSAPTSFGFLHLAPALPDFLDQNPEVSVELSVSDRLVDVIEDGFDLALRIGALPDSSLIARRLSPIRRAVCASMAYIQARGRPETPEDLRGHDCLLNSNAPLAQEWRFAAPDGGSMSVEVRGRLSANNGEALRVAALNGLGFAYLPTFLIGADVQYGALTTVLESFVPQDSTLSAVYPHSRHLSPKVRALVDFLADRFRPSPYWDRAP